MASIHLARQAPSRAIEELDSAHALDGKLDVGMRAELAKLRGLALLQLDRSEEAASALQQALTLLSDAGQPLTLAKVHLTRAEHATALGIDPRPDLEAVTAMPAVQALPPESQQRTNLQRLATLTSGLDPPQEG